MHINRGDVFFADIPPTTENVQYGIRPVLILSNEKANYFSTIITICPISTKAKRNLATHVQIELDETSYVLCEQILTINKKNLLRHVMKCPDDILQQVDKAIDIQLQKRNSTIFNINRVNRTLKAIKELEDFIEKYSKQITDLTEIHNSLNLHIADLKDYCCKCGVDFKRFYNNSKEGEMGENASGI